MSVWKRILIAASPLVFIAVSSGLPAAEKIDLDRITPVPADQPVPASDFFRPPLLHEPKLNPSGTHVAALITIGEDRHQLVVYDLKTQKTERTGGASDMDIYSVTWLNDQRLVFELVARKLYGLGMFAADVGRIGEAYPVLQYYGTSLLAVPRQDRLRPLVWNRYDQLETLRDLGTATVNTDISSGRFINLLDSGATRTDLMQARDNNEKHIVDRFPLLPSGLGWTYYADKEGRLEFGISSQEGRLALQHLVGGHWERCPVDLEQIDVLGCGEQPGQLVVLGPRQQGKPRAVQFMDGVTGALGEVLLQDDAYDFYGPAIYNGALHRDPLTRQIIGVSYERNGPRTVWFSDGYRQLQKVLDGFFPGLVVRIISGNEAQSVFLVATFSDRQPVVYHWVDLKSHQAGPIKSSAPWIDAKRMQPVNIIKFKTRDGRQLDAYLTLPAGATKANPPPLVVLPHGGPWARDSWGFDGEAQFLASRGYAVLKPNYRGSNGYAWMFPAADRWDFIKMHDDVTDATKAMIGSGLIDGGRVAIMGASFGGYLAVSGVVREPALYRCAITLAGVFDWEQQLKDKKFNQYDSPVFGYLKHWLGDPAKNPEKYAAISPGRRVDQIRVPVFVCGGKDDQTVEIEQSDNLISALEKYHVPHETLLVSEEGHGMRHIENRVKLYTLIEAFLEKNLKPAR